MRSAASFRRHIPQQGYFNSPSPAPPEWCRVAVLLSATTLLREYNRALYADLDMLYDEHEASTAQCGVSGIALSLRVGAGPTVMHTNWILFCHLHGSKTMRLAGKWAKAFEDIRLQDQAVFNKVFKCERDVTCVYNDRRSNGNGSAVQKIETSHCASFLERTQRLKCMTGD